MAYQVVARRFRPRDFTEVVGQEGVTATLIQGLKSDRIAHAWLFCGPRGTGKTTTARILSRALNCADGPTPTPCGVCPVCKDFLAGSDMDVEEIDGASNRRIEDVRELRERVGYKPMRGAYRIFIIDEVHMLTKEAFNALLKTLEEPPAHVVFILATTESHKVPETIRSRCQTLTFRRIGEGDIRDRLAQICQAEAVGVEPAVLAEIAASVRGGMRDAESLLERVLTLSRDRDGMLTLEEFRTLLGRVGHGRAGEVVERVLAGDLPGLLGDVAAVVEAGLDEGEFLAEVVDALREVLLVKAAGADTALLDVTDQARKRLAGAAEGVALEALMAMLRTGMEARTRLRRVDQKRVALELALLQMARARDLAGIEELLVCLREGGGGEEPAAPPAPVRTRKAPAAPATPATPAGAAESAGGEAPEERLLVALAEHFSTLGDRIRAGLARPHGEGWVVEVPGLSRMEADRFARPESRQRAVQVAEAVFGKPVPIKLVPPPGQEPLPAPRRPEAESDRVKFIKEKFEGEVIPPEQTGLFAEDEDKPQDGEERKA